MKSLFTTLLLLSISFIKTNEEYLIPEQNGPPYQILNTKQFDEIVLKTSEDPYLIFFGAEWCPHCRNFKPVFEEIAFQAVTSNSYPKLHLIHVDCGESESREICNRYPMRGLPTIMVAYKGKVCKFESKRTPENVFQH